MGDWGKFQLLLVELLFPLLKNLVTFGPTWVPRCGFQFGNRPNCKVIQGLGLWNLTKTY